MDGRPPDGDRNHTPGPEHRDRARPQAAGDGARGPGSADVPPARDKPRKLRELPAGSWRGAFRRTLREYKADNLADWAAALTYYAVLSIFPAILVIVSLVGLGGASVSRSLIDNVGDLAPGQVRQVLVGAITQVQDGSGAGLTAIVGVIVAIWSASRYVAGFMRAGNAVYDVPEGRPIWKKLPIRVGITLLTLVLLSASAIAVVVTGPLARRAGDLLGLGSAAVTAWDIAKWPVMLVVIGLLFAVLYWASPNARRGFRWVTPGSLLALVVWLAASALFALYVANFGSYNKTYGSVAAVIVFLIWLWITNVAILLGAELDAELERGRAMAAGRPEESEPYVELRDTRALDKPAARAGLK